MQTNKTISYRGNTNPWIEKLLQTPIDDYRKNAINLILAPYLVNVKKFPGTDILISKTKLTLKQYYSRMSSLMNARLVKRKKEPLLSY